MRNYPKENNFKPSQRDRDRYRDPGCPRYPDYPGYPDDPNPDQGRHIHSYRGRTSYNENHSHNYRGTSSQAVYNGNGTHYHEYQTFTTTDRGHSHQITGRSGPAIRTRFGHIHEMNGETSINVEHQHQYSTETSRPIPD